MAYLIRKGLQLICNHSLLGLDYVIELASQWVTSIIRSGQFHINVIVFVTTTRHQAPRHCRASSWTVPGQQLLARFYQQLIKFNSYIGTVYVL